MASAEARPSVHSLTHFTHSLARSRSGVLFPAQKMRQLLHMVHHPRHRPTQLRVAFACMSARKVSAFPAVVVVLPELRNDFFDFLSSPPPRKRQLQLTDTHTHARALGTRGLVPYIFTPTTPPGGVAHIHAHTPRCMRQRVPIFSLYALFRSPQESHPSGPSSSSSSPLMCWVLMARKSSRWKKRSRTARSFAARSPFALRLVEHSRSRL